MKAYQHELKLIRAQLGYTQAELGAVLGVEGATVYRYEAGLRQVPEPVIRLARQLVRVQAMAREEVQTPHR
jgi:DNA-binding XRE family transcriptional regulator